MLFLISIILFLCVLTTAEAWNCKMHKLTIDMIRPHLSHAEENQLLSILNHSTIIQKRLHSIETITDSVCLPDTIKRERPYRSTAVWHYLDIDYDPNHDEPISEEYFSPYNDSVYNAIIDQYYIFLESPSIEEQGDALLFILHLIGDAMQPFHVIQLHSPDYPNGDRGGLLYYLARSSFKNLHLLTDSLANYFNKSSFKNSDLVDYMESYCEDHNLYGSILKTNFEDMVEDWIMESHNRGIAIYQILDGSHRVSKEQKEAIQSILLQGLCRSTTILLEVVRQLLYNCIVFCHFCIFHL